MSYSLIGICYERYGSQDYEDYESLESVISKITNELTMYETKPKLSFNLKKNHMIIKDNIMMEYIITGLSVDEQNMIIEKMKN
jgi:hypothetical protein